MADYHQKKEIKVTMAAMLSQLGWKIFGFKENMSDSMIDYFDPADWEGVATKNGYTLCVGVLKYDLSNSGKIPTKHQETLVEKCKSCNGSGDDRSGWTLEKAKANPEEYNAYFSGPNARSLLPHVVSPIPFEAGVLKCRECNGRGGKYEYDHVAQPDMQWPTFQANPGRSAWHIEKDDEIFAKGSGLWAICDAYKADEKTERLQTIINKIEAAITPKKAHKQTPTPSVEQITVKDGTREGFSEIYFPDKPSESVREALKSAKFRWSRFNKCWYGKTNALPEFILQSA